MGAIRELRARFSASAQGFNQAIQGITSDAQDMGNQTEQATEQANGGFGKLKNTLLGFAGAYLGFEAIKGAVGGVIGITDEYQKALGTLQSQTGATDKEMDGMSDSLKNIYANNYGEDFNDIAESMAKVGQNTGQSGKELEKTTQQALMLRDTMGFEVGESTATASLMMKQFGITSEEAFTLIAQGQQSGLNSGEDLLDSFSEYSVYFKTLGYDAEGMWDVYNAGIDAGVLNTDVIGDTIKEFGILAKDGSDSTAEAFAGLGLNAEDMSQAIAKGGPTAQKAMEQTFNALGKIDDPVKRNTLGVALFGGKFEDLEQQGVIALGNVSKEADMTGNTLKKMDEVKYANFSSAMEGMKRQIIVGLLEPIEKQVMPMLSKFVNFAQSKMPAIKTAITGAFSGIAGIISELAPTFKNLFNILMDVGSIVLPIVIGAFLGIMKVLTPIVNAVTGVVSAFTGWAGFEPLIIGIATALTLYNAKMILTKTWTTIVTTATKAWAVAQRLLNVAMNLNPIGIIIALIAGLVAGLIYAYQNSETFREIVLSVWSAVKTAIGAVIDWLVVAIPAMIDGIINWFKSLGPFFTNLWSSIMSGIEVGWGAIKSFFSAIGAFFVTIWEGIKSMALSAWEAIKTGVMFIVQGWIDLVTAYITTMKTVILAIFNAIKTAVVAVWEAIKTGVMFVVNAWVKILTTVFNAVKTTAITIFNALKTGIVTVFNAIKTTATTVWNAIKTAVIKVVTAIKTTAISLFNAFKTGVTTVFNAIKTTATTVWNAIKNAIVKVVTSIKTTAINLFNTFKSSVTTIFNSIKSTVTNIWNAIKTSVVNVVNGMKSTVTNVANSIKTAVTNAFNSAKTSAINAFNALKTGVSGALDKVKSSVSGMKDKILSTLKGINLLSIGKNIIDGLINGIKSKVGAVGDAIKSVASGITSKIKGALGIHSPSRVFMEIGQFTGEGLGIGIEKMQGFVSKATQSLADSSFGVINSQGIDPLSATIDADGQSGQTNSTTSNSLNIENYYQNTDTDARSLGHMLFKEDRNAQRKKGK